MAERISTEILSIVAVVVWAVVTLGSAPAGASSLQENFNDYGASNIPLNGLNGGSGFGGAWASSGSDPVFVSLASGAGNNLGYRYDNTGNESDAVGSGADGAAGANGGTVNDFAARSVGSLSGTLWISILVRFENSTDDVYLWLDSGDLIGIEDQQAVVDYGGGVNIEGAGADDDDLPGSDPLFAVHTPHLLLLKVVFDSPGLAESYSFWVDPTLDGSEAGLGPALFNRAGINALAGALTNIGVAFSGSSGRLDAIRLSNDADGLLDVASPGFPVPALSRPGFGLLGLLLSLAAAYGISGRKEGRS